MTGTGTRDSAGEGRGRGTRILTAEQIGPGSGRRRPECERADFAQSRFSWRFARRSRHRSREDLPEAGYHGSQRLPVGEYGSPHAYTHFVWFSAGAQDRLLPSCSSGSHRCRRRNCTYRTRWQRRVAGKRLWTNHALPANHPRGCCRSGAYSGVGSPYARHAHRYQCLGTSCASPRRSVRNHTSGMYVRSGHEVHRS